MSGLTLDLEKLQHFEDQLDPRDLAASRFPVRVIGYGEISTVLDIDLGDGAELAYKRMPLFHNMGEVERYQALYEEYTRIMGEEIGIRMVEAEVAVVHDEAHQREVVYIVQRMLPAESIGHKAMQSLPEDAVHRLVLAVVAELEKVYRFNEDNREKLELGIDGQISNWAVERLQQGSDSLPDEIGLIYVDTSTPLLTRDGEEQLDPQLFLRSAPSFLVWILELFFLEDVLTRYYDLRKVCIDLMANFYKEQRSELIPGLVALLNDHFAARIEQDGFEPFTVKEIEAYYREDALIWRLYLAFRKVDRWLHRLFGQHYPYLLPGRIKR
jgi:hypothetical protein